MEARLQALQITEAETTIEEVPKLGPMLLISDDFKLCAVGRFHTYQTFLLDVVKNRMAEISRPKFRVKVSELTDERYIFPFYHKLEFRWVMDQGPSLHNGCILLLRRRVPAMARKRCHYPTSTYGSRCISYPPSFLSTR
ncbi:hypothetical protein LINGRAHAP2_LOCUS31526 [Linum grandiflorum]